MWDGATRTFDATTAGLPADLPFLFNPGEQFGPYLIVRPLGKGGMGQVYEAEEIESGRRVAMKVLSRGIGDEEERERFLSEGRVAASLSHPNTVYVFGTSEVHGLPVIAMELAPAGTLKDLVVDGKPMTPAAAVDAILQVIAGLEAAGTLGILHRDVKPSNCFVDRDGRVLVGDFGLSIATLGHIAGPAVTSIAGTPGFASPEQLRGEALDVRSDIYAVGATLYYLLTGRPPFEDPDITRLITRIGAEAPASPISLRDELPKELSAIIMRCLASTAADRYPDYRALAAALEPFRSTTLVPAGLVRRFLAGAIDTYAASLPVIPLNIYLGTDFLLRGDALSLALTSLPVLFTVAVYYGILEGRFGAAAGKAMVGLRVVRTGGMRPGFLRATLRAAVFVLPSHVLQQAVKYIWLRDLSSGSLNYAVRSSSSSGVQTNLDPTTSIWTVVLVLTGIACFAVLFSTVRRRNGYAGLHDLASGTRVVLRPRAIEARARATSRAQADTNSPDADRRIGPFVVTDDVPGSPEWVAAPQVVRGYDDRLHRSVWVQLLPLGTPPVPALRRDLGRTTRTRWLAGRRTERDAWDAYEAIDGTPLVAVAAEPQPWSRVRHWIADLAHEGAAGLRDGSLPSLAVDRVWIGADERVRLLDWSADGAGSEPATPPTFGSACALLHAVASHSLRLDEPLPIHARELMRMLSDRTAQPDPVASAVDNALRSPAVVRRSTRVIQVALCALLPVLIPLIAFGVIGMLQRMVTAEPKVFDLRVCLEILTDADTPPPTRDAVRSYMAANLRTTIEDPATWKHPVLGASLGRRGLAEQAVAAHAKDSPAEVQQAEVVVRPLLEKGRGITNVRRTEPVALLLSGSRIGFCIAAVIGLVGALVARGGLTFSMLGTAVVRRDGSDASRIRTLLRAAIAWAPVAVMVLLPDRSLLQLIPIVAMVAGAAWVVWHPSRGIQDRVAGTWVVAK